jgi:hypothetical protein
MIRPFFVSAGFSILLHQQLSHHLIVLIHYRLGKSPNTLCARGAKGVDITRCCLGDLGSKRMCCATEECTNDVSQKVRILTKVGSNEGLLLEHRGQWWFRPNHGDSWPAMASVTMSASQVGGVWEASTRRR